MGIDLRAKDGYGKDFHGYHKSLGIIDAMNASCAKYLCGLPYVDGERIGIWGRQLGGGFLTLMA